MLVKFDALQEPNVPETCAAGKLVKFAPDPVTVPSILATRVPVVIVISPVELAVPVVVPTVNLSALSSQAIIALSPVEPRSIKIPASLALLEAPLFNSIKLSVIVVLVVATVVVVPFTVRSPVSANEPQFNKPVLGL